MAFNSYAGQVKTYLISKMIKIYIQDPNKKQNKYNAMKVTVYTHRIDFITSMGSQGVRFFRMKSVVAGLERGPWRCGPPSTYLELVFMFLI